jgi:hypothetical protein
LPEKYDNPVWSGWQHGFPHHGQRTLENCVFRQKHVPHRFSPQIDAFTSNPCKIPSSKIAPNAQFHRVFVAARFENRVYKNHGRLHFIFE